MILLEVTLHCSIRPRFPLSKFLLGREPSIDITPLLGAFGFLFQCNDLSADRTWQSALNQTVGIEFRY